MDAMSRAHGRFRAPSAPPAALHSIRSMADNCVRAATAAVVALVGLACIAPAEMSAQSLRGSPASLDVQNRIAREHDYTYIDTPQRVRHFVDQGYLVRVRPNRDYTLHAVSFPYARPEVALFIERLGQQYRSACGEQLVVTSLTRPTSRQPRNASARSVHPTGMAVDLRYSRDRNCRAWLEGVLLGLERQGVLNATLERYPPHYHVAVFPRQYVAYVDNMVTGNATTRVAEAEASAQVDEPTPRPAERMVYTVQSGDSLWRIARQHGISVDELQAVNELRGNRIYAGQVIDVPLGG
jgi:hypothetical protein